MKVSLKDIDFEHGKIVSNPKVQENNLSFSLQNKSDFVITKWNIDKAVLENKEEGCDFLILAEKRGERIYYWIELKRGSDILKASSQILNSINRVDTDLAARHEARIVVSKIYEPAFLDNVYLKFIRYIRSLKGQVKVYTNQGTERI